MPSTPGGQGRRPSAPPAHRPGACPVSSPSSSRPTERSGASMVVSSTTRTGNDPRRRSGRGRGRLRRLTARALCFDHWHPASSTDRSRPSIRLTVGRQPVTTPPADFTWATRLPVPPKGVPPFLVTFRRARTNAQPSGPRSAVNIAVRADIGPLGGLCQRGARRVPVGAGMVGSRTREVGVRGREWRRGVVGGGDGAAIGVLSLGAGPWDRGDSGEQSAGSPLRRPGSRARGGP